MNTDKFYAEQLANEYAPKDTSKVVALRKLDAKAKRPANIFTYTFGKPKSIKGYIDGRETDAGAWDMGGATDRAPVTDGDAVVIGSGCAGLNAVDWLYQLGETDAALITEDMNAGTSRNTGSDNG